MSRVFNPDLADLDMRIRARLDGIREAAKYQKQIPTVVTMCVRSTIPASSATVLDTPQSSDCTWSGTLLIVCIVVIAICATMVWSKQQQRKRRDFIMIRNELSRGMSNRAQVAQERRPPALRRPGNFKLE